MSVSPEQDPLTLRPFPDRLFYETGALLAKDDFRDEQTYHRGRLARALRYLHGSGTVAGLRVEWIPREEGVREEHLTVKPGLAIDRWGRIIEVPRSACLRLDRWYRAQDPDLLTQAFHPRTPPVPDDPYTGVVVDLFIRFTVCERGKTPIFATGPFDALDAVAPSRLRDWYELELVLRPESDPPLPRPWHPELASITDPEAKRVALKNAILDNWRETTADTDDDALPLLPEHRVGQDPASIFLARMVIPATAGSPPVRTSDPVTVDNLRRPFVVPPFGIARWLDL